MFTLWFRQPSLRLLEWRFDSAGADCTPTDPRLKRTEESNQNKDRGEKPGIRDQTCASEQKHHRDASSRGPPLVVDVRLDFDSKITTEPSQEARSDKK
jgi:hypothetical protein